MMNGLEWTTEIPTKAGYYWWRYSESEECYLYQFIEVSDEFFIMSPRSDEPEFARRPAWMDDRTWKAATKIADGEWAGPVLPPIGPSCLVTSNL